MSQQQGGTCLQARRLQESGPRRKRHRFYKPRQRCHSLAQRVSAGMWEGNKAESALADGTSS